MSETKAPKLFDIVEAAAYLGLKKSTLYEWIGKRKIEYVKIGRLVKFDPRQLDKWIAQHTVKAAYGLN